MSDKKEVLELVEFIDVNGNSIFIKIKKEKKINIEYDESRIDDFINNPQNINNFQIYYLNPSIF